MTAAPPPLRVGLVGYGIAGFAFHAPLIDATPGVELAAIVTRDPGRRAQAAERHPRAALVDSVDDLLARPADLDVVVVASPNRTHVDVARAALAAGLHVVVDKPMAATAAECRDLADAAERAGRVLTVFHNRRYDHDCRTLVELLAGDALGEVHRFESRYERWRPEIKPGWRERPDADEAGGILWDLGSHLVDQALLLFGPAEVTHAEVRVLRPGAQVDDDAFVALAHPETGVTSHLWMGALVAQAGPRMRVLGSRAAWTSSGMDPQEAELRAGRSATGDAWGAVPERAWGLLGVDGALRPHPSLPGDYRAFYRGLVAAVREGAPPPVDPRDAAAVVEVLERARAVAARNGT